MFDVNHDGEDWFQYLLVLLFHFPQRGDQGSDNFPFQELASTRRPRSRRPRSSNKKPGYATRKLLASALAGTATQHLLHGPSRGGHSLVQVGMGLMIYTLIRWVRLIAIMGKRIGKDKEGGRCSI